MNQKLGTSDRPSPMLQLILARLREFYRQPEAVFWVYFFPILMVVALGIAFRNKPIEEINVDIADSPQAQALIDSLKEDKRIKTHLHSLEECQLRLRVGKSDLYVLMGDSMDTVDYYLDPTKPGSLVARDTVDQIIQRAAGREDLVTPTVHEMTEPGGRYIDFLVPGLIGMGLMGGGLWGVGFAIVDMRIRKLLKRFLATPMKKSQFMMGVMVSRLIFMVPEMILLIVFARVFFDVHVYGNWLTIILIVLLGAFQFSGIGLLVACRAKTLESVSGLMNLTMLPMWMLSGIFFSYERFPAVVLPFIKALPLTPLIDSLRSVMLEGTTLFELWPQLIAMVLWTVVTFAIALKFFRWHD